MHLLPRKLPIITAVCYLPIIDGKPTDMATVYTTMSRCANITQLLGQEWSVHTMDQSLYATGKQVQSLNMIWEDGGLQDLLQDSEVHKANTVSSMLAGK